MTVPSGMRGIAVSGMKPTGMANGYARQTTIRRMESAEPERGFSITGRGKGDWQHVSLFVECNDDGVKTMTLYVNGVARQTKWHDPRSGDYVDPLDLLRTRAVVKPQVYMGIDVAAMWEER